MSEQKMAELVTFVVCSNSVLEGMEPKPARKEPAERVQGKVITQSYTNDVSLWLALVGLMMESYGFVESYYEVRETAAGQMWGRTFYVLTFTFARNANGRPFGAYLGMFGDSLWQVRVYRNPLFRDGKPVDGEFTLSVNCHRRDPLYNDDGSPVMRWVPLMIDGEQYTEVTKEDVKVEVDPVEWEDEETGSMECDYGCADVYEETEHVRIYEVKRPLAPASFLKIDGDTVSLVPAE